MKLLILGGYGYFGGRLARLLADTDVEMLIAGRSLARAERYCREFEGTARMRPLRLDRAGIAGALERERPDIVVDASGPFQAYGDDPYRVVEACIAAGVNYLDLADSAEFVFGIDRFDAAAKAAGVLVLAGVSSFPVLTAAVLDEMAARMTLRRVEAGIAPSPHARMGLNVMRAVLSYAGSPVKVRRDGRAVTATGLGGSRRFTVAVPGEVPLGSLRFSLVDVPDLRVLPVLHPEITDIWVGAAPRPEPLLRVLNGLAMARAVLGLPSLAPLARACHAVLNTARFGEDRGGMVVRATGLCDGREVEESWHLIAEREDGPLIPSMAAEGVIRKMLAGEGPAPGARPGAGALDLADYARLFEGRAIRTGFRRAAVGPLYRRVMGEALDDLPEMVRSIHNDGARTWRGTARITRGRGLLARLVARAFGFPDKGTNIPVTVSFAPEGRGERWTRDFGGHRMSSLQWAGAGRNEHLLLERFGPVTVALALVIEGDRLSFVPRRWWAFGVPMPKALMPHGESFETVEAGRFRFDVDIRVPLIGRIVRYRGALEPVKE